MFYLFTQVKRNARMLAGHGRNTTVSVYLDFKVFELSYALCDARVLVDYHCCAVAHLIYCNLQYSELFTCLFTK